MKYIVDIKNVDVMGEGRAILHDINLQIQKNENWCILGPNGSGKSSLIKLICSELYPYPKDGSECKVFGKSRWDVFELRAHMGIVTNDLHFLYKGDRSSTGFDIVLSGFFSSVGIHKDFTQTQIDKTHEIIRYLDIKKISTQKAYLMSTGEIRKCLIARALVHDPELLILDEPTSGLDMKATHEFLELLKKLSREHVGIVLVTHHIEEIFEDINNIAFLKNGTIVKQGVKESLLTTINLSQLFDIEESLIK